MADAAAHKKPITRRHINQWIHPLGCRGWPVAARLMMDVLGRAEAHASTHLQQRVHVIITATTDGHSALRGPSF